MNNGKKTLMIVAAEWCPHCKEELPEVQKFYDANKDKINVVVVFTNSQTNLGKTQTYVKDNGYTFPAYFDENGAITRGFAVDGFPYNLKITNGKVEEKLELPVDFDSLTASFAKQSIFEKLKVEVFTNNRIYDKIFLNLYYEYKFAAIFLV